MNNSIENNFTYHAPKEGQPEIYAKLRESAKKLALLFDECVPDSREKSLALTKLEEAIMWANAGVARNEKQNRVVNPANTKSAPIFSTIKINPFKKN